MGPFIVMLVFAWALKSALDKGRREYRATRDHHAASLARANPGWHPRRVSRAAGRRALGHWLHELNQWPPFPAFRHQLGEDLLFARTEAAEAGAAGAARRKELWKRLNAAQETLRPADELVLVKPAAVADDGWPAGIPHRRREPVPSSLEPGDDGSAWLRPGETPCTDCHGQPGSGRGPAGDVCKTCCGFGSQNPSPGSPETAAGTVCDACGRPGTLADPVIEGNGHRIHRSHTTNPDSGFYVPTCPVCQRPLREQAHDGLYHVTCAEDMANDCCECGLPLSGDHDTWRHAECDRVLEAERRITEIYDSRDLGTVERELRDKGLCPHQTGTYPGSTYCGRAIGGDEADEFCLEHRAEADGDDERAQEEHWANTRSLLERDDPDLDPAADIREEDFDHGPEDGNNSEADAAQSAQELLDLHAEHLAAWHKAGELRRDPDSDAYKSAQAAAVVKDDEYRAALDRTLASGHRQPGEEPQDFAARTAHQSRIPLELVPDPPAPPTGGTMTTGTDHDTSLEGADTPHEAMQGAFDSFGQQAAHIAAGACDDLRAAAAVHGMDRDQQTMQDIADIEDQAAALQARAEQAKTGLASRHEQGAEYHANGQDAHASAFRPA